MAAQTVSSRNAVFHQKLNYEALQNLFEKGEKKKKKSAGTAEKAEKSAPKEETPRRRRK